MGNIYNAENKVKPDVLLWRPYLVRQNHRPDLGCGLVPKLRKPVRTERNYVTIDQEHNKEE